MGSKCPTGASLRRLSRDEINQVVRDHNKCRNEVAGGQTHGKSGKLTAACRMPKLVRKYFPDIV